MAPLRAAPEAVCVAGGGAPPEGLGDLLVVAAPGEPEAPPAEAVFINVSHRSQ